MSNLTNNRINTILTAGQISSAKAGIAAATANLPLIGLTVDERTSLPTINVSNKAFTEDAINAGVNNPSFLPSFINIAGMQTDLTLFTQLDEIKLLVQQLLEKIEDTQLLAGNEAYTGALAAYKSIGNAADAGIPGADAAYALLKARFTSTTTSSPVTPP